MVSRLHAPGPGFFLAFLLEKLLAIKVFVLIPSFPYHLALFITVIDQQSDLKAMVLSVHTAQS